MIRIEYCREYIIDFIRKHKLYYAFRVYNKKRTVRFDFIARREAAAFETAKGLLDDLFVPGDYVFPIFYGCDVPGSHGRWRWNRDMGRYFRLGSVKRMSKREYYLTGDKDYDENNPYFVLGQTRYENINMDKYLRDLFRQEHDMLFTLLNLKKSAAINFYNGGCDVFAYDVDLLNRIADAHKEYLIEM